MAINSSDEMPPLISIYELAVGDEGYRALNLVDAPDLIEDHLLHLIHRLSRVMIIIEMDPTAKARETLR